VQVKIAASISPSDADVRNPAFGIAIVATGRDYSVPFVKLIGHETNLADGLKGNFENAVRSITRF
jgi:hypothetical protein